MVRQFAMNIITSSFCAWDEGNVYGIRHRGSITSLCSFATYIDIVLGCREWREFQNPARKDTLKLSHWIKASTDPSSGAFLARPLLFVFAELALLYRICFREVQYSTTNIHLLS